MFEKSVNIYEFIRLYDIEATKDLDNVELKILFTKLIVKLGHRMQQSEAGLGQRQEDTILAAENYIVKCTEENWDAFCQSSTNSFPFGPGDGCYCVEKTGIIGCKPGSGCISGIGTIAFTSLPEDEVWLIIKETISEHKNFNLF
jgi:hypothetical protein